MAKDSQKTINLKDTFAEFKELKNIDQPVMISVIKDSFRSVIAKIYGTDENFNVVINPDKGDCEIYHERIVVEDGAVEDELSQIELTKAREIDPECEIGEDVSEKIDFVKFGRRAVLTLRQTLSSKILELQKEALYDKYKDMVGEIVYGEVYQIWKREILLLDAQGNEMFLPIDQKIPSETFRKGDSVKAVVVEVANKNNNLKITVSRTANLFLQRLFELEIPEVQDNIILIKKIARIPGEKAKVAVESVDDRIDPVGSCVGVKGSRIHSIVRELRNENIDVINYTSNNQLFITRALSPAKISSIKLDDEEKRAEVSLKPEEVSLAIGKNGYNIRLASMLTGYEIEVFRDVQTEEEDIYLDEFSDEIEQWIIDILKENGYGTAKSVLTAPREVLLKATDLEEETIDNVLSVLAAEFE